MRTMTRVSGNVEAQVRASQGTEGEATDHRVCRGRIGATDLNAGWFSWGEMLTVVAAELWRRGEVDAARVTVKTGRLTVRQFLRERFGIVTGAREYWHRDNWTPDRADRHEFLQAVRNAKGIARRVA